jgi:hypothetical protein
MPTAVSYLSAVSEADARARVASTPPTTTPALSLSSSLTSSSDDVVLDDASEFDNSDGLVLPLNPPTSEQVFTMAHTEFGHCANDRDRYQSQHPPGAIVNAAKEQDLPYYILLSTYISYIILICIGHVRTRALNISSYNYLGFAQSSGGCADAVEESLKQYGVSSCGTNDLHVLGEALVARFVGMEGALISSMGFATNSTFIHEMVGKGCLVISDELNHASIRFGVRLSDANVQMFKHNDMNSLEALLKEVISQGSPRRIDRGRRSC